METKLMEQEKRTIKQPNLKRVPILRYNTQQDIPIAGYGACKACDCKGYKKSKGDSYCSNCGHHYDRHY